MSEYHEIPLKVFVDLAKNSSPELATMGKGYLLNYENGRQVLLCDEETADFLASAREIVLELARRIQSLER